MFRRIKSEEKFLSSPHSTHNAPGDRQASPTMAIPVLATSKQPLLAQFCVPAVRSTFADGRVLVYPLDREMVGEVWDDNEQRDWSFQELSRAWLEANTTFQSCVDYPLEYMQVLLSTLRSGVFLDNSLITPARWKEACRRPSELMIVQNVCSKCSIVRAFAMRTLLTAPSTFPKWKCSQFGLQCSEPISTPIYAVAPDQWLSDVREESNSSITPDEQQTTTNDAVHAHLHAVPKLHEHVKSRNDDRLNGMNVVREATSLIDPPVINGSSFSHKFITWSQVPSDRRQSDQYANVSNRNPSALRRPAPSIT